MKRRGVYALVAGLASVAAVALMLAFVVLPGGSAAVRSPEAASVGIGAPEAVPAFQEVASRPGGPQEGIAVHGHWTIEVRNPDGSLVERREFDNELSTSGTIALVQILAREIVPGKWAIIVHGTDPCEDAGLGRHCVACEPNDPWANRSYFFDTLTLSRSGSVFTLSGSVTVANNASITEVETRLRHCSSLINPDLCAALNVDTWNLITSKSLSTAVPVIAGQQVLITVDISFS